MTPREELAAAAARVRAWLRQDEANQRAWFERHGHPVPDPLWPPDEEVGCHFGCGTDMRADDGTPIPLLVADLDKLCEAVAPAEEKPLMAKRLLPEGMMIPGELLLDAGVELPAGAPADALYRVVWGQSG